MKNDNNEDDLSLHDIDDDIDLKSLVLHLREDTDRNKNKLANDFTIYGEDLLAEIDEKNLIKDIQKQKQIRYILKHAKTIYSERILKSYSFEDIQNIYNELKEKKRPIIIKIFRFIFNI